MTKQNYLVALHRMPKLSSEDAYWRATITDGNAQQSTEVITVYEGEEDSQTEMAAAQAVKSIVNNPQMVLCGSKHTFRSPLLGLYVVEVSMELESSQPRRAEVPSGSFLAWLDYHQIDSERLDWSRDVAIQLLTAMGYVPDDEDWMGFAVEDQAQTLLMQAIICLPGLEYVADLLTAVNKFGRPDGEKN